MQSFYILQELYRKEEKGQSLTDAVIEDCFTPSTLSELQNAIYDLPVSVTDTILECNELLQDLAVNYLEEGLYEEYLEPLITQAEQLSEMAEDLLFPNGMPSVCSLKLFIHCFAAFWQMKCIPICLRLMTPVPNTCWFVCSGLPSNMLLSGRLYF